ncbi:unnamed protein product [Medioppia subpectinata]|uniref:Uncharacterized protein n=1 Tax=Medioppia subpectinata TaxID=1979941 RepID=A0A7R9KDQ1_9ACAR|nr:unnamed protein product [Medioppia subpectinata]CAG2100221.1 unnamed protein product [Medioppia subpectinata]
MSILNTSDGISVDRSGNTNGVIVTKNANISLKSEIIDIKAKDNCLAKNLTQLKTNIGSSVDRNPKVMIFCGQKLRQRNDSVSSVSAISTTIANTCKQEDLYSTSGDQSSPSPQSASDTQPQDMFCSSTMSADCSSNTSADTIDAKCGDTSPKRVCLVCGDTASGFHYGVAFVFDLHSTACEACKAFFKRTIQGNIEYTCPAANDCEINKRRRKACQACRFQKCLRMGMLKEGVRLDRVRGGRQKYRRSSESPYLGRHVRRVVSSDGNVEGRRASRSGQRWPSEVICVKALRDSQRVIQWRILLWVTPIQNTAYRTTIISALIGCEPEPLLALICQSSPTSSTSSAQYKSICSLSDLVDRELVATIGWAKQIPGFTDLILNDQMRLLQTTWAEVLSLSLAFRIVCNARQRQGRHQPVHRVVDILLEDSQSVSKLRETLLMTLQECVSALRPLNSVSHLSQLLLCMPLLRQLDGVTRRYWNCVRRESNVPMNKLFVEMLESNITMR